MVSTYPNREKHRKKQNLELRTSKAETYKRFDILENIEFFSQYLPYYLPNQSFVHQVIQKVESFEFLMKENVFI